MARSARQTERSAGQKGRGLESGRPPGIFARPRFPPPPNFVFRFAKCAAGKRSVALVPPNPCAGNDKELPNFV